ncbi:hypothetical protein B0H34DRAFT_795351 [Crassisporium funariophilum]|nr:hypothetical protein B0H34DRAFT_795351 [Crassisporium funariophilum]
MSFEALGTQLEQARGLSLEIPSTSSDPTSSAASSVYSSPTELTPSTESGFATPATTVELTTSEATTPATSTTTTATASTSSLPTLNVRFAPLPELAPRKRRSTAPLGMAARGQLMRRRRGHNEHAVQSVAVASGMWTDEEMEEQRRRHEALAARHAQYSATAAALAAREDEQEDDEDDKRSGKKRGDDEDVDDPFLVLGRMMKGAGKTFWRKVSNKDMAAAAAAGRGKEDLERHTRKSNLRSASPMRVTSGSPANDEQETLPTPRPILATITSNSNIEYHEEAREAEEGGVWEEEIGHSFPLNVSQTETVIEGRAIYSMPTSKGEALSKQPPSVPSKTSKSPPMKSNSLNGKS